MADTKVTALTAITALTSDDLLYTVEDPGGSPLSRKITWANVQASLDAELVALAAVTSAANKIPYFTGSGTASVADFPVAMRTFLTTPTSANLAALVSDDSFSFTDAELAAIAGLTSAANKFPYFTGSGTAALADLSANMRTFLTTPTTANFITLVSDIAASTTKAGISEIAIASEINTGTSTTLTVSPDALAGSNFGRRVIPYVHTPSSYSVVVGDGEDGIPIDATLNGHDIIAVTAYCYTQGVTGTTDVQIRRRRAGANADVLSTKVTLGAEYYVSDGVINTSNDDLATGDLLYVDVDAVHTTAPLGLSVSITTSLP